MRKRFSIGRSLLAPSAGSGDFDSLVREVGRLSGALGTIALGSQTIEVEKTGPVDDQGPLVLALEETERLALQRAMPLLAIDEDAEGFMARWWPDLPEDAMANGGLATVVVQVRERLTGKPLPHVPVRLEFVDGTRRVGAAGTTDQSGDVALKFARSRSRAALILAEPEHSHAFAGLADQPVMDGASFVLECDPLLDMHSDALDTLRRSPQGSGAGIRVAVVDGGVGPHQRLRVSRAETLLNDGKAEDNGVGHGTHVAGLIQRLAPDAELWSYRVFESGSTATNASLVAAAVRRAVKEGADLVNLSVVFQRDDKALTKALEFAHANGVVCVCAAGNDAGPVSFPARHSAAVAVAACGSRAAVPASLQPLLRPPAGSVQPDVFATVFTCFGTEVSVTAPGLALRSYFPHDRLALMNGTSMAAPVVTGWLAAALTGTPRDGSRLGLALHRLFSGAQRAGLPSGFEGHGVVS